MERRCQRLRIGIFFFQVAKPVENNWNNGGRGRDGWTSHERIALIFFWWNPTSSLASKRAIFVCNCLFVFQDAWWKAKALQIQVQRLVRMFTPEMLLWPFEKLFLTSGTIKLWDIDEYFVWKMCVLEGWLNRNNGAWHSGRANAKQS